MRKQRINLQDVIYYAGFLTVGIGFFFWKFDIVLALKLLPAGLAVMGVGSIIADFMCCGDEEYWDELDEEEDCL